MYHKRVNVTLAHSGLCMKHDITETPTHAYTHTLMPFIYTSMFTFNLLHQLMRIEKAYSSHFHAIQYNVKHRHIWSRSTATVLSELITQFRIQRCHFYLKHKDSFVFCRSVLDFFFLKW